MARLLHAFNTEFATPTPTVETLTVRLDDHLASGALAAVLVELDDDAVGLALLSPRTVVWYDGPLAVLDELYVAPEHRSAGLGTRLLHAVEAQLIGGGYRALEINVDGDDLDARRFYERHGYRNHEPGEAEPLLYYYREFESASDGAPA